MYCRQCHYDLRGQTTNRCPECGKAFDPNNPDSFYPQYPSFSQRWGIFIESPIGWRGTVLVLICMYWFGFIILPATTVHSRGYPRPMLQFRRDQVQLESIMGTWLAQQKERESLVSSAFDKQAAIISLPSALSTRTQQDMIRRRGQIQDFSGTAVFCAFTFVPPLALAVLLWPRKMRWVAGLPLALLLLVGLPSLGDRQVIAVLVPGSHAYLDDFVYLQGIDLLHPTGKLAAYGLQSLGQDWRVVAYDDGHAEVVGDPTARSLFEQQGIPYPPPRELEDQN